MNGQLKNISKNLRHKYIKTWYLFLILLLFATASVYFLRQNNLKMVELRNQVIQADQQSGDVATALKKLNKHVFEHMNTQIVRPVELVTSYNREARAVIEAANSGSGRDVYAEATAVCEKRGVPLSSIAQCTADYAVTNNPSNQVEEINLPDKNLFIHTFATPLWTPDAAGFSIAITVVIILWILLRVVEYILVRIVVKRRLSSGF